MRTGINTAIVAPAIQGGVESAMDILEIERKALVRTNGRFAKKPHHLNQRQKRKRAVNGVMRKKFALKRM